MGCQYVDAATVIDSARIRVIPGALRNIDNARKDARCDAARKDQSAAVVMDFHMIAIANAARRGIQRIDEDSLRKRLFQPIVVIVC